MSNLTFIAADNTFGPFTEPISRTLFDFTKLFEESIFSIGPSTILLLAVPPRIWYLSKTPRKVARSPLALGKLFLVAGYAILHAANLALCTTIWSVRTQTSTAAAALSLAASVSLACLSYMEHVHSVRPSPLINVYLLFTLPLDFAQVRTLWLRAGPTALSVTYTSASVVKIALLIAEAVEKGRLLVSPYDTQPPEATSGIYSRALFWWLNPLFLLGYKDVLSNDSLLEVDAELMSRPVYTRFARKWTMCERTGGRFALVRAWARTMSWHLAGALPPRLCLIFFRFMQPLLIHRVSRFVSQPSSQYTTNQGWGLTGAYGLVYVGLALSQAIYYHQVYRMITMTRGALVTAIYAKTTQQSATTIDESAAVTLMSADVQNICDALKNIQEVWASIVEIALGIWLLTREIGLALLAPLVVTVVSVFATMFVSRKMAFAMKSWMGAVQSRIDTTSKMLESMIGVKMLGLTPTLKALVSRLRKNEINTSLRSRKLLATCICLANAPSTLAPGFAFVFYVLKTRHGDGTLDVSRAFTALSLISLVTTPVSALIFAVPPLMESFGCVERIQSFLSFTARQDHRLITKSCSIVADAMFAQQSQDIALQTFTSKTEESPLRLINTSFAWTSHQEPVVQDVSFELAPGSLTFIVGPVGCGKSTLLRGILGEIPISQGFVYVDSPHTALVQQSPWIQHKSLRHNVLGTSMFDKKWYDIVLHACALEDIATLPEGDLTIVGSAGHRLSGGQRLRLALARAVYSRSRLLILDDPFSGLDPETEEAIFTRLVGRKGLLRQIGITVLLVTHAAHRFSFADYVIALTAQGTVGEEGTFSELMSNRGYVASVVARRKSESDANEEYPAHLEETKDPERADPATEEAIRPLGDLQVYKYYFSAAGWRNTAVFFIAILIFAFFSRFPDLWMKLWTSAVAEHGNSVNATYLGVFVTLGVIALLCVVVVAFYVFIFMVPESAWNFHEDLLTTVMSAPSHFFTTTSTGQTLNRFSQDLTLVDMELPTALIQVSGPFCLGVVQAIFICLSAAYFVTALPPVFVVLYFLQKYYLRTSRQIRLLEIESKAPLYSHFLETLSGLVTIRAFGWTQAFEEQNVDLLDKSQKPFYLLFCIQRWLALVLDLIVAALTVILMVMVVKLREQLDSGFVALALFNIMSFNTNLTAVIQMWTALESSLGAVARLKNFKEGTKSENLIEELESVPEDWPANGRLEIVNLSARYAEDLPDVVQNINLSIAAGEKVAICGTSGSGKSSLIACLFRMLEISNGSVVIDGRNISRLPRQTIRQHLNAIPQSSFFFKGSIRRNLDPWGSASNDQIETALRKVGLWDIITSTSLGIESELKDVEELLSHGQRQLFCLARATLKSTKVVVMDEVSSSVDLETDKVMQGIVRDDFAPCTVIAVAHRLETIVDFDRVVVMQSGRIIEVGKPQTLLKEAESAFKKLWDA